VVAGDHHHADAGVLAGGDGLVDTGAGRVDHGLEPEEDQPVRFVELAVGERFGEGPVGEGEDALAAGGEPPGGVGGARRPPPGR
jgi:hypothetical protein